VPMASPRWHSFQTSPSETNRPSVINSTYTISDRFGSETFTLHEEGETLVLDRKGKPSESVEYAKVKYIPNPVSQLCGVIESNGNTVVFLLRSEEEAKAVAEYIGRRAGLELVGDVWRSGDGREYQCKFSAHFASWLQSIQPAGFTAYRSRYCGE